MNIRKYDRADLARMMQIHSDNGLPPECFPDLVIKDKKTGRLVDNPLYHIAYVCAVDGAPVVGGFLKLTNEAYLIVDHTAGTPQERWDWVQALASHVCDLAFARGMDEVTAWLPPELVDTSFEDRMRAMGFERSKWVSFTKKLT